jgi:hypothetical protein
MYPCNSQTNADPGLSTIVNAIAKDTKSTRSVKNPDTVRAIGYRCLTGFITTSPAT